MILKRNFTAASYLMLLAIIIQLATTVTSAFTIQNSFETIVSSWSSPKMMQLRTDVSGNALIFGARKRTQIRSTDDNNVGSNIDLFDESIAICNQVILVGRIGLVPEPRYLPDGKVVLNVGLAVKRQYNSYERKALNVNYGEEETDWFTLELWGKNAEFMAQYVTKGARVGVSGSLFIERCVVVALFSQPFME